MVLTEMAIDPVEDDKDGDQKENRVWAYLTATKSEYNYYVSLILY